MEKEKECSPGKIWFQILWRSTVLGPFCLLLFAAAILAALGRFILPVYAAIWFIADDWAMVLWFLLLWILSLVICRTNLYKREFSELFREVR